MLAIPLHILHVSAKLQCQPFPLHTVHVPLTETYRSLSSFGKMSTKPSRLFFCVENIWYFTLNLSGEVKFSIYQIYLRIWKKKQLRNIVVITLNKTITSPPFTTFCILRAVSLTFRDISKLSLRSKFARFLSQNGKQTSKEELSFKSIVAPTIRDSYQLFKI